MALAPRLDLRQSQQLVMTPQLQQAIKLLQLTNIELGEFVAEEIEKNPLLEASEPGDVTAPESDADQNSAESGPESGLETGPETSADAATGAGVDAGDSGADTNYEPGDVEATATEISADQALASTGDTDGGADTALDADYQDNVFNNDSVADKVAEAPETGLSDATLGGDQLSYAGSGTIQGGGGFSDDRSLEERMAEATSLKDFLDDQLRIVPMAHQDKMIAAWMLELVDDAGYLTDDLGQIAEQLQCNIEDVERILDMLQGLEPVGVFARNLAECLALQLKDRNRYDPCMEIFLEHLDLLGKRDFAALRRVCGVDNEDLIEMVGDIQALNPKPGLSVGGGDPVQSVVADVFVRKNPAGLWTVELNSDTLPKVLINASYYAELSDKIDSKDDKAYLSDCFSTANWLVKALDQRARTILKVSSEIVRQQEGFFNDGVRHLKPLNLKAIADAIEMHESTVSRVTSNKYLATSRGIFELKYFFNSAIAGAGGSEQHSAVAVRDRIKELIENEDAKAILSDDKIVDILAGSEIDIARRTVAKYREAMGIPSSVQRRRQKKMLLA